MRRSCRLALPAGVRPGGERYKPAPERVVGTSLLRLLMRLRLGQPISDGTSGMYAVNHKALDLLSDPYVCEAPEVEALMRIPTRACAWSRSRCTCDSASTASRRSAAAAPSSWWSRSASPCSRARCTGAVTSDGSRSGRARRAPRRLRATEPSASAITPQAAHARPIWRGGRHGHSGVGGGVVAGVPQQVRGEPRRTPPSRACSRRPPRRRRRARGRRAGRDCAAGCRARSARAVRRARGEDVVDVDHRPAATAVRIAPRPSGAATAAASSACANGSAAATR